MANKVTIIGAGSVGATIGYTLAVQGAASEIVFIDINNEKALGEALDIQQGASFCAPCVVRAGTYEDAKNSDFVIFTSGMARKPGQTRLDLTQANVNITKSVIPEITKAAPNAIYIIVANPVDILTYQFIKTSGIPENHIIGSGTLLDTSRLRDTLAQHYGVSQRSVHAYVFGEHGDSSFVPWSLAHIGNVSIDEYGKFAPSKGKSVAAPVHAEVEDFVRKSGGIIIKQKGATFYAIAISVCHLVRCIMNGSDTVMTVSSMLHGEYGIEDVCLSTLSIVNKDGVAGKIVAPMTDEEVALLHKSSEALKDVIKQIQF